MTSTEIVAQDELRHLIETGAISYTDLLNRLSEPEAEDESAKAVKPKSVVLSPADRKILRTLPAQLAYLDLPGHARKLTENERAVLVPLFVQVKVAKAAVTKAEDALKVAMHGHIDALSDPDAPSDKNGHKLTEGEVVAPGYDKKVVRGLVGHNATSLSNSDLQAMERDGLIDHAQYLRMTKVVPATRTVVPDAIMGEIKKHPELLMAFAGRTRRPGQTTAVRMAKN